MYKNLVFLKEFLLKVPNFLQEKCAEKKSCAELKSKLDTCNDRVNSRSKTTETCQEELFDYFHCVDHCVSKDLFKFLK